ncbi:unnamed protein product, partial [Aphanomyces euteiches]
PAPAHSSGLELAPPPAQPAVPSYAHPACHSYTDPRPICYYYGIPGHNSNHCMTLLAHYMREPKCMNVGFDPDVFHRTGKRLLELEQRRSRRSRQSVPRHSSRDNRDPLPGGAGGSHYRSSNVPPLHLLNMILPRFSLIMDHNLRIGLNPLLLDLPALAGPYLLLDRRLLD